MSGESQQPESIRVSKKPVDTPGRFLIIIPIIFGSWLLITSLKDVIPNLGVYDGKRILELYLICITSLVLVFSTQIRKAQWAILMAIPKSVRIGFMLFFVLGISSALRTPNPAYPVLDVAMLFLLAFTTVTLASSRIILKFNFDRLVLALLAVMGFGVLIQELLGMLVYVSTDMQFNYRESLLHFLHPRLYNQVQTWTIPLLALLPVVFIQKRWMGPLGAFLIGLQWYIILSTGARGTTVSLILAMLIVGIAIPSVRKHWLIMQASGFLLGILFFLFAAFFLGTFQPGKSEFVAESVGRPMLHTSGRTDLWKHAIDDAIQNPLLGSGPMRYACDADHYIAGSPHSFPLQIMGEWGIPAFLLLGLLFGWLMKSWFWSKRNIDGFDQYDKVLVTCLSISCLAATIHVCVSGLLIAPSSQVAGMLVVGWLLGALFNIRNKGSLKAGEAKISRPLGITFASLGLAVSISVIWFATSELDHLPYRTSYAQDFGPSTPRFWQDGRFCEYSF